MSEIKVLPDRFKVADLLNIKEEDKCTREKFINNFTDEETMQEIYKRIIRFNLTNLVGYVAKLEGVPQDYIRFLNEKQCYLNLLFDYDNIIALCNDEYLFIKKEEI